MRLKYRKPLSARKRRHVRVRAKVSGTSSRPRLNVFRSSAHIYVQVIDDLAGHTLVQANDLEEAVASALARGPRRPPAPRRSAR